MQPRNRHIVFFSARLACVQTSPISLFHAEKGLLIRVKQGIGGVYTSLLRRGFLGGGALCFTLPNLPYSLLSQEASAEERASTRRLRAACVLLRLGR